MRVVHPDRKLAAEPLEMDRGELPRLIFTLAVVELTVIAAVLIAVLA